MTDRSSSNNRVSTALDSFANFKATVDDILAWKNLWRLLVSACSGLLLAAFFGEFLHLNARGWTDPHDRLAMIMAVLVVAFDYGWRKR